MQELDSPQEGHRFPAEAAKAWQAEEGAWFAGRLVAAAKEAGDAAVALLCQAARLRGEEIAELEVQVEEVSCAKGPQRRGSEEWKERLVMLLPGMREESGQPCAKGVTATSWSAIPRGHSSNAPCYNPE